MKLPRNVDGADAVKALIRLGFQFERQKGSHMILRRGPNVVVVPNHRPILVGTLAKLLREAGVSIEEFVEKL
jgi:predicted RNA binding protein YcfA (HicA-like mRNA interferase family)